MEYVALPPPTPGPPLGRCLLSGHPRNWLILRRGVLALMRPAPVVSPGPPLSDADGPVLVLAAGSRSRRLHFDTVRVWSWEPRCSFRMNSLARRLATSPGLRVIGTVGLLMAGKERGSHRSQRPNGGGVRS